MPNTFLTANWARLAFANYEVDPHALAPWLPKGVELDPWQGKHLVSLVGFRFLDTRLLGLPIPFHRHFPEVNLRFYVRYLHPSQGWVRGVVFVKEIVPKPAITFVANTLYHERYATSRMRSEWTEDESSLKVRYSWKTGTWNHFEVTSQKPAHPVDLTGDSGFITEHYWGFSAHGDQTMTYEVAHPSWSMYPVTDAVIEVDFGKNYGEAFAHLAGQTPHSLMLAEGSAVSVRQGRLLKDVR